MDLSTIRDETRWITKTDTSTFSNTNLNRECNIIYKKIILEILKVQGYRNSAGKHVTTSLLSTSGLVAGNAGFNGEYPFPTDMMRPIRFELKYAAADKLVPCKVIDMAQNDHSLVGDDSINDSANEGAPIVRFFHDSYFISPVKTTTGDITAGINIWYEYRQTDLSADGDEPQFESSLHDLIPLMVAERFYLRHPSKRNAAVMADKESTMRQLINFYKRRMPLVKQLKPLQTNFA
jgi:hypothetical protein